MLNRFVRWLARDIIKAECNAAHRLGQAVAADDRAEALRVAYLDGITDGVAIAVQEPGTPPQMMSAPEGVLIRTLDLWHAIDRADIVRRGIQALPGDRPMDIEGVKMRADQMRDLLRPKG